MTTYAQFVTALAGLTVSGVERKYSYPPPSVEDLPASFVMLPSGDDAPMTFGTNGGSVILHCQYLIIYQGVVKGEAKANFTGAVAMMDALSTALRGATGTICKGKLTWSMRVGMASIGGTDYWAVIADVSGETF